MTSEIKNRINNGGMNRTGNLMNVDYSYLYDWLYKDSSVSMYLELAREYEEILECGIGTGRLAIPLAESGTVVFGIDNSSQMLDRLNQNLKREPRSIQERIHGVEADMRHFDLGRIFPLIMVGMDSFNFLLTLEDQKSCLEAFKRHMSFESRLVMVVLSFSGWPDMLKNDSVMRKVVSRIDPETEEKIELWRTERFDASTQIIEQDRHFRFYDKNGVFQNEFVYPWRQRFFFLGEIKLLLDSAGFSVESVRDCPGLGPYTHSSEDVVVTAKLK